MIQIRKDFFAKFHLRSAVILALFLIIFFGLASITNIFPKAASVIFPEDFSTVVYKLQTTDGGLWVGGGVFTADTTPSVQTSFKNPTPGYGFWDDVDFVDDQIGWLLDSRTIMKTTDGGVDWIQQQTAIASVTSFVKLSVVSGAVAYIATIDEKIIKTTNGGTTWGNVIFDDTDFEDDAYQFSAIDCIDADTCFVSGGSEDDTAFFLISTTDGFDTFSVDWDPGVDDCKITDVIDIDFTDATTGWFIGDDEICKTEDGGLNFTAEVTGAATTFADLEMFDDLTGWAVGSGGKVYATQDGDTWATQTCSGCGDLASIDSASATHVWISDETNDRMIISTVGGEGDNWQNTQSLPITFDGPLALDVVSTTNAFVIGSLNNDLTKTINGIAWTDATFNPTVGASVDDIDFSTLGTNGWAVSGNSIVYSTDSGETWDDGDVSALPGILFNSVDFVDDNDGWAVGNGSTIAYSSNAGLGWAAQVTDGGAPGTFSSVSVDPSCASPASPPACVVIAGGTGNVYYTADGGATNWHNSDVVVNINAVQMLDSLNGIAVSDSGKIFRTENAGVNFVEVYDAGAVSLKGIGFAFPTTVGIVVGSSGTILRTEDAGATWAPVANPSGGETFEEVSFYNASDGFIVSSTTGGAPIGGEVLITSNGGATWTESDESYVAFNSVKALDAATIWITGANGVISKSYIAPVTETAGFAYSTTVDDTAEDIVEVTLTADDSASPINTGFRYAVSNNGGNDFYEVEPCEIEPCEPFRFPGYGSDLRFQVIAFSGSLTDVPVLNDLTLDYTTNAAPDVPTFSAPADSATGVSTTGTVFTFSATDADSNDIYYVLDIATDAAFTNVRHHFDQRQNGTGWSQDGPYNSGSPATFTLPDSAQLAGSTTYYARVIAIDTFESSATSTAISFSTTESEPVTDPFDSYSLFNLDTLTAQLTASAARFSDAMFDDAGAVTMQFLRSFAAGAATVEPKEISAQITMDILDLDRDGILDFFHAGTGSTNVNFLENYFWPSGCGGCLNVNVTAQGNVNDLDHGNFNNDSYIDLVIASSAGIKIVSFGDAADTELAIGATTDVEVADIDRDGKDEIIVSGDELLMEPIVEFVGEGTYQTSAPTDLDTSNLISVAADFDLDGDMDIAHGQTSAANDPGNHLYIREADGTYTKTVNAFGAEDTDDFKIADLDLDGDMDVVLVYNDAFGNIDLYINNGSAEFTTDPLNSWIFGQQINKIVLADADLDGDPDLFVAGDVSLEMLTNEGDGTFMDLFPSVVGGDIIGLMVNDVDGNGGADIVYATAAAANILRDDVAYATQDTAIADFGDNIATGDIDGDGDIDAISNTNAEVNQHINNGDGTFTTTEILADGTPTVATAVALYDVDADSDLDAIFGTDTPVLAFNPGTGFDGAYTDTSLGASTYARYVFGDLDIDGDADILLQKAAGGIDWFRNDGGETFTDQGVLGVAPQFAIMLDFDLDGDADSWKLTSDIHPSQKGTWTEQNDGGLVFSNDSQLFNKTVGERDHTLGVTADFDNDGDADVFEAGSAAGESIFWWNKGNGEFSSLPLVDYARVATHLFVYDFEGDGDLDIFLGDTANDETDILINNGKHVFSIISSIPVAAKSIARIHGYGPASILYSGGYYDFLPTFDDTDVTVRSLEMDNTPSPLTGATLTINDSVPVGSDIIYYLSNDGGVTWEGPVTSGDPFQFNTSDDLRWRADLSTTDTVVTPAIYDISLSWTISSSPGPTSITPPAAPTALSGEALSKDSIRWNFVDNANNEDRFYIAQIVDSTKTTVADTAPVAVSNLAFLDETELLTNTKYCNRFAFASNAGGSSSASGEYACVATLADVAQNATATTVSNTRIDLAWELGQNPPMTEFSVKELNTGLFVQPDARLGTDEAWFSFINWNEGDANIIDLAPGTEYTFAIYARNFDSIKTEPVTVVATTSGEPPRLVFTKTATIIPMESTTVALAIRYFPVLAPLKAADDVSKTAWPIFLLGAISLAYASSKRAAHDLGRIKRIIYIPHVCFLGTESAFKKLTAHRILPLRDEHFESFCVWRKRTRLAMAGTFLFLLINIAATMTFAFILNALPSVAAPDDSGEEVRIGDTIQYQLAVENSGPGAVGPVTITDEIRQNLAFQTDSTTSTHEGAFSYDASTRILSIAIASIPETEKALITFRTRVSGDDPTSATNQGILSSTVLEAPLTSNLTSNPIVEFLTIKEEEDETDIIQKGIDQEEQQNGEKETETVQPPPDTTPPGAPDILEAVILRILPLETPGLFDVTFRIQGLSDNDTKIIDATMETGSTASYDIPGPLWVFTPTFRLAIGDHVMAVTAYDSAGNQSSATLIRFTLSSPECFDAIDNDGDGVSDFPADPGCLATSDTTEADEPMQINVVAQCLDETDNDADGLIDYPADPGCESSSDTDETDRAIELLRIKPQCNDEIDNDGDGRVDFPQDPGCRGYEDSDETNLPLSEILAVAKETAEKQGTAVVITLGIVNAIALAAIPNLLPLLQLVFTQPFFLLGRTRRRQYGIVYNSFSKLPVDLATVRLVDENGNIVRSHITDAAGRYILTHVPQGRYRIEVSKNGFSAKSQYVAAGAEKDGTFDYPYTGALLEVAADGLVTRNIPIDPIQQELSHLVLVRGIIKKKIIHTAAVSGPILSLIIALLAPMALTAGVFLAHLFLYSIFRRLAIAARPPKFGSVFDHDNNQTIKNVIVRIFENKYSKLLDTQITDARGRYSFLVGQNAYFLTFEHPQYEKIRSRVYDFGNKTQHEVISESFPMMRKQS